MPNLLVSRVLPIALVAVFVLLALLHVYWGLGGRTAWIAAVPEVEGRAAFTPSAAATFAVAGVLACFAIVVAGTAGMVSLPLPDGVLRGMSFALAAVFLVRAVGDFRLVGFFKTVRGTGFGWWDSVVYSPLCLAIAVGVFVVGWGRR